MVHINCKFCNFQGIGKSLALSLAKRGLHIILLARSADKLALVEKEILQAYPHIQTKIVAADLTRNDAYDTIASAIQGLSISILINNAGGGIGEDDLFLRYHQYTLEQEQFVVQLNLHAVLRMTRLVLPIMMERKQGRILNLSSMASLAAPEFISIYGSCKAFVNTYSKAIDVEYGASYNIHCASIVAGLVTTPANASFSSIQMDTTTPDHFAEQTCDKFGMAGQHLLIPYWPHALQGFLVSIIPEWVRQMGSKASIDSYKNTLEKKKK